MVTLWFCLVAFMLTAYAVLDGFDLGVGALHLWVGRDAGERKTALRAVGPVWDGNEVWLLAGGGTLYFAFPALYASGFSGFYLPLMIVLWLLILRAVSVEFRNHSSHPMWVSVLDVTFSLSSLLLLVFFGAALGNVVRGVPLNTDGWFFLPLWTDFRVSADPGILDWYTILMGVTVLAAGVLHGALWLFLKTEGVVAERARKAAWILWVCAGVLAALAAVASLAVQPAVREHMSRLSVRSLFPVLMVVGWILIAVALRWGRERGAFLASCAFLAGLLGSAVFSLFPLVLPSVTEAPALTVFSAAAREHGLRVGLAWWIPGMLLVLGYFVCVYRGSSGKVR